jgi:hypothetical protein
MTLSEVAKLEDVMITPDIAAKVIGMDPSKLRLAVEEGRTDIIGFPVMKVGSRVKIPKGPFCRFCGWEGPIVGVNDYEEKGA